MFKSLFKRIFFMDQLLEVLMLVSFGLSWPTNILKAYKVRTARGKSFPFLVFVLFGYGCGIAAKVVSHRVNYVVIFYATNMVMVIVDMCLYFRNRALDRQAPQAAVSRG
jgi:hypothetical protein